MPLFLGIFMLLVSQINLIWLQLLVLLKLLVLSKLGWIADPPP
jgi:hypothetical protein